MCAPKWMGCLFGARVLRLPLSCINVVLPPSTCAAISPHYLLNPPLICSALSSCYLFVLCPLLLQTSSGASSTELTPTSGTPLVRPLFLFNGWGARM
jgi:hypothetical protein